MADERATDLVLECTAFLRSGEDFPTIRSTRLKNHPLVIGRPQHRHDGTKTVTEVRLITGERMMSDASAHLKYELAAEMS